MRTLLFLVLFGYAACDVVPSYPSSNGLTNQYNRPFNPQTAQNSVSSNQQVPILRLDADNNGDGTYNYAYETGNGISAAEQGDASGDGTRARGGFSYTSPEGQQIQLQYTADENGFLPQGNHLPAGLTGAILRSVQNNLEEERRGISDDGQYRGGPSQGSRPQQQYNSPSQQFNSPSQQYNTPSQQYNSPSQQYNTPSQQYNSPSQQYGGPQNYNTPQKYGKPTDYTPQGYNSQQYNKVPQSSQYIPPGGPQGGYKY